MTNQVQTETPFFYREPPPGGTPRWLIAGVSVVLLHVVLAAMMLHRQPVEPMGTSTEAVLVDLTPLPAPMPPSPEAAPTTPPQVAAPNAAPPPSPTPEPDPAPRPPAPEPTPPPPAPAPLPEPAPTPQPAPPPALVAPPTVPVLPKVAAPIEMVKPDPAEDARIEANKVEARRRKIAEQKAEARKEAEAAKRDAQRRDEQRRQDQERRQAREQSKQKAAEVREKASKAAASSAASPASLAAWGSAVSSRIRGSFNASSGIATVSFHVSGNGQISGVRVVSSSDPEAARSAASAVRNVGSVEPPPDHLSKNPTVHLRVE